MKPSETVIIPVKVLVEKSNKITRLKEQIQQAIALIKDGRFVEALRVLEDG